MRFFGVIAVFLYILLHHSQCSLQGTNFRTLNKAKQEYVRPAAFQKNDLVTLIQFLERMSKSNPIYWVEKQSRRKLINIVYCQFFVLGELHIEGKITFLG